MKVGFKLIAEAYGPVEIVEQAVRAEEAGFDFVEFSDHFHLWVSEHEHSGFAFSMLAAIAARTSSVGLATGVTCPLIRYHPAVATRHEMLRESLEIIHLLWSGGYQSYDGKHLRLEDARVFDLPDELPDIAVAAGGADAARLAGDLGDALSVTEPDLVAAYEHAGGKSAVLGGK
ncbi:LLM class flavin-dependent oxidoreductase [Kribbella sp. NPDC054772]